MTHAVLPTAATRPAPHLAIIIEEERVLPDLSKALPVHISGLEFGRLKESARIDFSLWTNAAGSCCSSAHIKSGQLIAKSIEMKERISCQNIGMASQPVGEFS